MSITFSPDGSSFTVPTDIPGIAGEHKYLTETWYPAPLPKGMEGEPKDIIWQYPQGQCGAGYWLMRRPLPPLPKTQVELDLEAFLRQPFVQYLTSNERANAKEGWFAALIYERRRKEQP